MQADLYAMQENALSQYLAERDAARELAAGEPSAFFGADQAPEAPSILTWDGTVAHIAVTGPLTQSGPDFLDLLFGIGGTGYEAITKALADANTANASQIVLDINSPGGEVSGVDQVWQAVRDSKAPVVAMSRGLVASAAYWIASGAKAIYASSQVDMIGSIGVMAAYYTLDRAGSGVKKYTFVSKSAPLKNADPGTDVGAKAIQDRIDAIERVFHDRIQTGRPNLVSHGDGAVLIAQDPDPKQSSAYTLGLVDGVRSQAPAPGSDYHASTEATKPVSQPASAGKPHTEESMSTLTEFLASNPNAKTELDALVASARTEGQEVANTRAEKVGKILASEAYKTNAIIQAKGVECLSGKISLEAFEMIVSAADAAAQQVKLEASKSGTETPGEKAEASKKEHEEAVALLASAFKEGK